MRGSRARLIDHDRSPFPLPAQLPFGGGSKNRSIPYIGRMVRPIPFGTVTRAALPDQIAARVVAMITERHLKPGDRLPPERELAQVMGVSRSSLREALRALSLLGVTEMRQGDGTYLTALDPDALMRPFGLVLALSDGQLQELFEARRVIEPGLAALAAERIDEETL